MSLMTNILAVLGVILIIVLVVYLYRKYSKDAKKVPSVPSTPDFPPAEYMEEVGTKCPDLWQISNINKDGSYTCINPENVPINSANKQICAQTATFKKMAKWPLNDKDRQKELANRCEWIENCGPAGGVPASWIGIDNLC